MDCCLLLDRSGLALASVSGASELRMCRRAVFAHRGGSLPGEEPSQLCACMSMQYVSCLCTASMRGVYRICICRATLSGDFD